MLKTFRETRRFLFSLLLLTLCCGLANAEEKPIPWANIFIKPLVPTCSVTPECNPSVLIEQVQTGYLSKRPLLEFEFPQKTVGPQTRELLQQIDAAYREKLLACLADAKSPREGSACFGQGTLFEDVVDASSPVVQGKSPLHGGQLWTRAARAMLDGDSESEAASYVPSLLIAHGMDKPFLETLAQGKKPLQWPPLFTPLPPEFDVPVLDKPVIKPICLVILCTDQMEGICQQCLSNTQIAFRPLLNPQTQQKAAQEILQKFFPAGE